MDKSEFEECPPSVSMIESLRNIGYDFNYAIADLLDNSISAGASLIEVWLEWNAGDPYVIILDNGRGMTEDELKRNMVIGSKHLNEERDKNDLGRFGLGLKTASFAISRQLSVFSKTTNSDLAFRCWDLDVIEEEKKYFLIKKFPDWYYNLNERFQVGENGTVIIWKKCDHLTKQALNENALKGAGVDLLDNLGAIFCRYIKGTKKNIKISVNGTLVMPWSPISQSPDAKSLSKQSYKGGITVHPYIMPHRDYFENTEQYIRFGGIKGWVAQQGFYVYRNDRLIVNGGWLGLKKMKNDSHTSLARIIIDLTTDHDHIWKIDVKKSTAAIPADIRDFLDSIARKTRAEAENVTRHRGKVITRMMAPGEMMWNVTKTREGDTLYKINRKNPLIELVAENYSGNKKHFNNMFDLLEKTLPTLAIIKHSDQNKSYFFTYDEVKEMVATVVHEYETEGKTKQKAVHDIIKFEPFSNFKPQLLQDFS